MHALILSIISDINECESNPCQNGGTCVDSVNDFMCFCHIGFTGLQCESGEQLIDINEFNNNNNDNNNIYFHV